MDITPELLTRIAPNATPVAGDDEQIIAAQIGRTPRGLVGVGARCACGRPAVTVSLPRLPDGSPFPTLFYLSLPWLVKAVSRVEATGIMAEMTAQIAEDEALHAGHRRAHKDYLARRALLGEVPEIAGVSAGGMPDRVKCLHALAAFALSVGPGVTEFGDRALQLAGWGPDVCHCEDDER
ncbi:DUF501 domain-containing protein [Neoactinobaculum massilliense]|uniref:DUF501 domain-containing protein n=1 Tax=Neoactinobaculum massilliense TaxID=2364794 RepID=UPI000F5391D1|nr:DUF501 domain-containing protein [Neoactinobaculum massilliense]